MIQEAVAAALGGDVIPLIAKEMKLVDWAQATNDKRAARETPGGAFGVKKNRSSCR